MNHQLYRVLIVFAIIFSFASCKDYYYIENALHGVWQVTSIERLSTGNVIKPGGRLYYMFQRSMIKLCENHLDIPEAITDYCAHFDLIAQDSIGMGHFRVSTTGEGDYVNHEEIIPLTKIQKFGFYQDYTVFHMQLSKNKLTLTSDSAQIILRRY